VSVRGGGGSGERGWKREGGGEVDGREEVGGGVSLRWCVWFGGWGMGWKMELDSEARVYLRTVV